MSQLGALALTVAVLAFVAAGCSSGGHHQAAAPTAAVTPNAQISSRACKLNGAQRRAVARARADIRHLRRLEASLQAFSQHGAPGQNRLTGKVMLELGAAKLPLNVYSSLIHRAKVAAALCGDCTSGLEADEPFFGNRAGDFGNGGCG